MQQVDPTVITRQLCEALDMPYESEDGHGMRAFTYDEALRTVKARSDAWRVLLGRIEEVDPKWLDQWRKGMVPR